ncbi:MAG: blue (type 1) copper domain protein [Verrucomicrobia bacterium]|nr:blue (type 1) copper domain protein [Verrucomicrobiota bacterium]
MKTRLLISSALVALICAGCGQKDPAPATTAATPAAAPASSGPRTIEITAGDNMKYNVTRIDAAAGEQITVVLTNTGAQPKEVMGHNWILLKAGVDAEAFDKAASTAKENEYFPPALANQVIEHIPLLGPRKSGEVTFKAPTTPGEYTFLCSFPAHFAVGMKGVLVVK